MFDSTSDLFCADRVAVASLAEDFCAVSRGLPLSVVHEDPEANLRAMISAADAG